MHTNMPSMQKQNTTTIIITNMSIMPCLQQNMSVLNLTRQLHDNDDDGDDDGDDDDSYDDSDDAGGIMG